jgi:hypothetical protein
MKVDHFNGLVYVDEEYGCFLKRYIALLSWKVLTYVFNVPAITGPFNETGLLEDGVPRSGPSAKQCAWRPYEAVHKAPVCFLRLRDKRRSHEGVAALRGGTRSRDFHSLVPQHGRHETEPVQGNAATLVRIVSYGDFVYINPLKPCGYYMYRPL